jgi:hypothetical protein
MPYPTPTDPDYCRYSEHPVPNFDPSLIWQRCPGCRRPISAKPNGRLYPHVSNVRRARRRDVVQESLIAHGLNRRERLTGPFVYSEPEPGPWR